MSEEQEEADDRKSVTDILSDPDEDTLRIMLSTDNHLGYQEKDPIRGMDSFAAFEEVLYLAKRFQCDMVLLAGDLFHDNRPSRRTLFLTMQILRKHCMGNGAVRVQVLSDPSNLRSGIVNYDDENYSVDLPIFSIHGNHDDPTRDSHGELLAALDLLSVANLVNYFGRQEQVDQVAISPVLLRKGSTNLALYGLGSLRDERLNRMWQNKKVSFLKPEEDDFFNLFALHQNRDLGRGKKNCVQESMIPEWMDIVMWGHEHECWIDFTESVVGTFRITQPGSSVATSLVAGEAVRKKVGVLDVNGSNFRMHCVPLTQVRSFVTSEVALKEQGLDALDPKIDFKIGKILEQQVRVLVMEAREKRKNLLKDALEAGNKADENSCLSNMLQHPDQVLVRIRVDHSGFSSINNQRFGAQFVGDVANPSDILLFSRKKDVGSTTVSRAQKSAIEAMAAPIAPEELEQTNMQDIVQQFLDLPDQKLKLLNENRLSQAMEEFVDKSMTSSINENAFQQLEKKQKKLATKSVGAVKSHSQARDFVQRDVENTSAKKKRLAEITSIEDDEEEDEDAKASQSKPKAKGRRSRAVAVAAKDDDSIEEVEDFPVSTKKKTTSRAKTPASTETNRRAARRRQNEDLDDSDDQSDAPPPRKKPATLSTRPKRNTTRKRRIEIESAEESEASVAEVVDDSDDDDELIVDEPPKRKARKAAAPKKKPPARRTGRRGFTSSFAGEEESDDDGVFASNSAGLDEDWGTATTKSQM